MMTSCLTIIEVIEFTPKSLRSIERKCQEGVRLRSRLRVNGVLSFTETGHSHQLCRIRALVYFIESGGRCLLSCIRQHGVGIARG